jgi:hypothetical protein
VKPSETEDLLNNWYMGCDKPFIYKGYTLYWDEYLVIKKEDINTYVVNPNTSSIRLDKTFSKSDMEKMLYSDELQTINDLSIFYDYKYKKSDGCQCGAYATQNPDHHSDWCPKCRKRWD